MFHRFLCVTSSHANEAAGKTYDLKLKMWIVYNGLTISINRSFFLISPEAERRKMFITCYIGIFTEKLQLVIKSIQHFCILIQNALVIIASR